MQCDSLLENSNCINFERTYFASVFYHFLSFCKTSYQCANVPLCVECNIYKSTCINNRLTNKRFCSNDLGANISTKKRKFQRKTL